MTDRIQKLAGRTWLIFAADTDLGAAFARQLAAQSKALFLQGEESTRLSALGDELKSQYQVQVSTCVASLADEGAGAQIVAEAIGSLPNISGVIIPPEPARKERVANQSEASLRSDFSRHCREILHAIQGVLPHLTARRNGLLLLVAQQGKKKSHQNSALFAASQNWLASLGCALHHEVKENGVIVSTICATDLPVGMGGPAAQFSLASLEAGRMLSHYKPRNSEPSHSVNSSKA